MLDKDDDHTKDEALNLMRGKAISWSLEVTDACPWPSMG